MFGSAELLIPAWREGSNRPGVYRRWVDRELAKRYLLTDSFSLSLPPFDPPRRLERIFTLACRFVVEVEQPIR